MNGLCPNIVIATKIISIARALNLLNLSYVGLNLSDYINVDLLYKLYIVYNRKEVPIGHLCDY